MPTTRNRIGKQAKRVTDDLQAVGETVRDAAREKLGQRTESASGYCEQGRAKVHGIVDACEQYLRQRPVMTVLTAAGIGWLLGRFWKRR